MNDKSCGTCDAWQRTNGDEGVCRANPPTPVFMGFGQQQGLVTNPNAAVPMVQSFFPPIFSKGWCRAWALKTDGEA